MPFGSVGDTYEATTNLLQHLATRVYADLDAENQQREDQDEETLTEVTETGTMSEPAVFLLISFVSFLTTAPRLQPSSPRILEASTPSRRDEDSRPSTSVSFEKCKVVFLDTN
jgi:hypothetical protein